jgi:hypothetical protein
MALTRLERLSNPSWPRKLTNHELLRELNVAWDELQERRFDVLLNEAHRRGSAKTLTYDELVASDAYKSIQAWEKSQKTGG